MASVSAGKGIPSGLPEVWFASWLFIYVIRAHNSTQGKGKEEAATKEIMGKHRQESVGYAGLE